MKYCCVGLKKIYFCLSTHEEVQQHAVWPANPAHNYSVPSSAVSARTSDSQLYSKKKLFWMVSYKMYWQSYISLYIYLLMGEDFHEMESVPIINMMRWQFISNLALQVPVTVSSERVRRNYNFWSLTVLHCIWLEMLTLIPNNIPPYLPQDVELLNSIHF
jgi:hypothetical protein